MSNMIMSVEEFNEKYYVYYKKEFDSRLTWRNETAVFGEEEKIDQLDLYITEASTGNELYHLERFTCLEDELNKFCKQEGIMIKK